MSAAIPAPSSENPPTEIPDIASSSSIPPKPVTPAEAIPVAPATALDPLVGEPSILDKAKDIAKPYLDKAEPYLVKAQETTKPYVDKVQETTKPYVDKVQEAIKPYTDKAAAKAQEIIDKIEGNAPSTSATPTSAGTVEKSVDDASASVAETGEKAKGIFEQGLSAVQSTFTQITHTIEERTASPTHPGLITQVTNAVHKGVERAEKFLDEQQSGDAIVSTGQPLQTTPSPLPPFA
ncbi:hypothetical protein IAR55_000453 [Kwoniella newhampshirensis]|uniref:Uncharacterized protein n=1 Tax=Kwoniella newhampshirensis TaxID=1651941 RepID=A0AAW0Z6R9_9TREE